MFVIAIDDHVIIEVAGLGLRTTRFDHRDPVVSAILVSADFRISAGVARDRAATSIDPKDPILNASICPCLMFWSWIAEIAASNGMPASARHAKRHH